MFLVVHRNLCLRGAADLQSPEKTAITTFCPPSAFSRIGSLYADVTAHTQCGTEKETSVLQEMPKLCSLDSFQPDLLTTPTGCWNHRSIEWLVLEGTSRTSKIQAPRPRQGCWAVDQALHLVRPLQAWRGKVTCLRRLISLPGEAWEI